MMQAAIIEPFLAQMARAFWSRAGGRPSPPVDLDQAVTFSLPLDIVLLSRLSLRRAEQWLARRNVHYPFAQQNCALHGLLLVYRGAGFIFLDGTDTTIERRYTLAHEVAHFLYDYLRIRERAVRLVGTQVLDVLDGLRKATVDERVESVLAAMPVRPYVHLLARDESDFPARLAIDQAENRADRLALELLAPADEVCEALKEAGVAHAYFPCVAAARTLLHEQYQIPGSVVDAYARRVAHSLTGGPSALSALGLE
ncbi:MAG: hypothetical protein KatS3mg043_0332 [Rhodothermaceae bacterium]|nr:MAG: hypothetical protein KatS3mg043_0332 [Rhodothermaceae bacterium]